MGQDEQDALSDYNILRLLCRLSPEHRRNFGEGEEAEPHGKTQVMGLLIWQILRRTPRGAERAFKIRTVDGNLVVRRIGGNRILMTMDVGRPFSGFEGRISREILPENDRTVRYSGKWRFFNAEFDSDFERAYQIKAQLTDDALIARFLKMV